MTLPDIGNRGSPRMHFYYLNYQDVSGTVE